MKRYETYKDSGIQWWEEIPTHWDLKKAKHIFSLVTENVSDSSLPKIALENIESWTGKYIETDSDFMGEGVEFKKDDILFGKLRPYLAKVYKAEFAGQAVGDIYVFRGNEEQNPEYLKYLLLSYPFISVVDGSTYGAKMPRANWDFISHLVLPCPPKTEQVTIAAFLDHKVGKIDATIAEKEQMLEDLKNYRSAIISEAVTKGLDKNVEMKDSGIEWMGMIPKHWGLVKLKNKAKVNGRIGFRGYTTADLVPKGQGAYTIGGKHITNCVIDLSNPDFISWDKYYESPEIMVKKGDILMAQRGSLGKAALVREDIGHATINPSLVLLNSIAMNEVFLYYYLVSSSCLAYIDLLNTATAVPMISQNQIENIFVPIPSGKEQKQIADYLDRKTKEIDETTIIVSTQISDLKSYKSALITEAVTGKIDLRDWKPKKENV